MSYAQAAEVEQYCFSIMVLAASAIDNRDTGRSKQELLSVLPNAAEDESRQLIDDMREIVSEVYSPAAESIDKETYAFYRGFMCTRTWGARRVVDDFTEIADRLERCVDMASEEKLSCVQEVVEPTDEHPVAE